MDASAKCYTEPNVSIERDMLTIKSRLTHEGLSFLTITLPSFGKEFEKSLSCAKVTSTAFPGWKRWRHLPAFLQGFVRLVFSADTGDLLDDPDIAAIEGIRQIAYSFKKLSMPCTPERVNRALSNYEKVECFLSETMPTGDINLFNKVSSLLWGNVFNEQLNCSELIAKHGPGQTAEHISGNRKYTQRNWHERLEPFFPSDLHLMSSYTQLDDEFDGINCVQFADEEHEPPVRVVTVPKTLKGPRIIAIEPVCMQYTQQALSRYIMSRLGTSYLTAGHINFTDQSINKRLAMSASSDGSLATIDLSDASDRVPLSLITTMLKVNSDLLDAILACRSTTAQLPSGKVLTLRKFASMGSALCFPIQAMYYYTLIVVSLLTKHKLPVTLRNILNVTRNVYVYGDDIIVPVDEVVDVMDTLTCFLCKVNTDKSFWNGKFRESCGTDAYDGYDVTPTYIHHQRPHDMGRVQEIISLVASSNHFFMKGYWKTARLIRSWIESILGKLPTIGKNSPALGWHSFLNEFTVDRMSKKLHRPEIRAYVVKPVYYNDSLEGWSALLKFFLNAEVRSVKDIIDADERHLSRSPRSGTSSIKRRWTTPY